MTLPPSCQTLKREQHLYCIHKGLRDFVARNNEETQKNVITFPYFK